jgi:hypothetical protein
MRYGLYRAEVSLAVNARLVVGGDFPEEDWLRGPRVHVGQLSPFMDWKTTTTFFIDATQSVTELGAPTTSIVDRAARSLLVDGS